MFLFTTTTTKTPRGYGVVVDSGSTFSYLPTTALAAVRNYLTDLIKMEITSGAE